MVRHHPQWLRARELVAERHASATLRVVQGTSAISTRDPTNVRNRADIGGGGLMDIGCYPIVRLALSSSARSRSAWSA